MRLDGESLLPSCTEVVSEFWRCRAFSQSSLHKLLLLLRSYKTLQWPGVAESQREPGAGVSQNWVRKGRTCCAEERISGAAHKSGKLLIAGTVIVGG